VAYTKFKPNWVDYTFKKVDWMKDKEAWAKKVNGAVEGVLKKHGVSDFVLVAASGSDVAVAGVGCTGCIVKAIAGAILSNVGLRGLLCEAMALAMSQEEERPILLN
jgi:D-arabinose 5-phosphate isomerase GutQ